MNLPLPEKFFPAARFFLHSARRILSETNEVASGETIFSCFFQKKQQKCSFFLKNDKNVSFVKLKLSVEKLYYPASQRIEMFLHFLARYLLID
ncbi:MAG: hypothetical protein PHS41_01880 [Victivallaceae bacterium]|nr:hypothetical protein [Victivallaceae bacterium]